MQSSLQDVCAVVVSYHPDDAVLQNLALLRQQVETIVVVDNGSTAEEVAMLRERAPGNFHLIENTQNLGIATALNQGVRYAQAQKAQWVFLFDQDSSVTEGFVEQMLCFAQETPFAQKLAITVPRYFDSRYGHVLTPPGESDGTLDAATTSGSLTPMWVFEQAGLFADELFIDGVDYEYSLRVRERGWVIAECMNAVLMHSPGTPTYHSFLGRKVQAANYSPIRRYYQERNKIWVTRRYWKRFLPFMLGQFAISAKDLLKMALFEPDRGKKIRFFFRGVGHGLRGKTGAYNAR
ncbi:glycosyltransferase family 2 protein [Granulicella cerasi]|uniref:Glycosyltransferase family 2 protein n=1 Tax=Granulicella cerasi TaxID=741063 RepID=A0ABW1Z8M8_9BACT|nr:glycosyltransferase family 2 protein [Granulicella cerasi]